MQTFTVQQIKKYLSVCDSLGDAIYNCTEQHITAAQTDPLPEEDEEEE